MVDDCGVCDGIDGYEPNSCDDCHDNPNGDSFIDNCGECVSSGTDSDGNSDDCDVCYGSCYEEDCEPNQSCADCAGWPWGDAVLDDCGVCGNGICVDTDDDGTCDCHDECEGDFDECGVCGGDNSTCCNNLCTSPWICNGFGDCNVCDAVEDCLGVCDGDSVLDDCGVCDGIDGYVPNSCDDCLDVINGNATLDCLGVCTVHQMEIHS